MPFDLPFWRQWEGQRADDVFPLERCTAGDDRSAVFETEFKGEPATIKLFIEAVSIEELQVRWEKAAGLSHPALAPILAHGETTLGDMLCAYVVTGHPDETLADALAEMPLTPAQALDSLEPVMGALRYLESKELAPADLRPANIMAFDDQIQISRDALVDFSEGRNALLRAIGLLLEEMLQDRTKNPPLPEPFAEIVRNCKNPDTKNPWDLARIEARLFPAAAPAAPAAPAPAAAPTPAAKPVAKPTPMVATPAPAPMIATADELPAAEPDTAPAPESARPRKPIFWWATAAAATIVFGMVAHFWPTSSPATVAATTKQASALSDPSPSPPASTPPVAAPAAPAAKAPMKQAPVPEKTAAKAPVPQAEPTTAAPDENAPVERSPRVRTKVVNGITQVLPEIPKDLRSRIQGQVRLNVLVRSDSTGKVVEATPQPPAVGTYYTARATAAAQAWKFPPPENNATQQDWVLRFEFARDATRVSVGRLSR